MELSSVPPYIKSHIERICQGDIFRDLTLVEWAEKEGDSVAVRERTLSYCVVLSQECDLEHDFNNRQRQESPNNDKYIQSILLCPAYTAETFRTGEHLSDVPLRMQKINSDQWRRVKNNDVSRYHFLRGVPDFQLPDLVIDFKHYFTAPRDVMYRAEVKRQYLVSATFLFRDQLSQRFAGYLSRIGLPEVAE